MSEIKVPAGLVSRGGSEGESVLCSSPSSGGGWQSLVFLGLQIPQSKPSCIFTWPSPWMSLCPNFLLLIKTPVILD